MCELSINKDIWVSYVPTTEQDADVLTKGIGIEVYTVHRDFLRSLRALSCLLACGGQATQVDWVLYEYPYYRYCGVFVLDIRFPVVVHWRVSTVVACY